MGEWTSIDPTPRVGLNMDDEEMSLGSTVPHGQDVRTIFRFSTT